MGTGLINTGITGIQVAQLGLQTASHNITNANTPGFNRQRTIQSTNLALLTGAGFVGQGANVSTVERMYNGFLNSQVNTSQTKVSELETYYNQISQIDNMLADANSGLSPALQDFFKGAQQVAANPSQLPSRQAMISSAQSLTARFQGLDERLSQMYTSVNGQITTTVASVNSYAEQIGALNQQIIIAQSSISQPANDLLDQRDQLVSELNKLVQVATTTNTDGSYNVFIGTGQQLVVGTQVSKMTATASSADQTRVAVGLQSAGGVQELPESLITGGSLGGLLRFRTESLDRAANDVGRTAASLALTFNAQHALGQDLTGHIAGDTSFVGDFFNVSQPSVVANTRNQGTASVTSTLIAPPPIDGHYTLTADPLGTGFSLTRDSDGFVWPSQAGGAAWSASLATLQALVPASEGVTVANAVTPGFVPVPNNVSKVLGSAAVNANFYTNLTTSDYSVGFDGVNYSVTRLSDGHVWPNTTEPATLVPGTAFSLPTEGITINLSGTMIPGDSFVIKPITNAARNISVNAALAADARLIAAGSPVRVQANSTNTGAATITAGSVSAGYDAATGFPISFVYSDTDNTLTGTYPNVPSAFVDPLLPAGTFKISFVSGSTITLGGISVVITGAPKDGDTFSIGRNTAGVSDGRNALALGQLQTQNTMSGKTASYQSAYAQLVSDNGNKTREVKVTGAAQQALVDQSSNAREALSGVNLDEEAANLIRYQQAYQASAKILDIGSKLFDVLLSLK
jgi:flagellar hook-associated protein 1 FlgK